MKGMRITKKGKSVLSLVLSTSLVLSMLSGLFASSVGAAAEPVEVWVTTGDKSKLLHQEPGIAFGPAGGASPYTIHVDENTTYQEIEGFGAALTDSSAWLLGEVLTDAARDEVMEQLFDVNQGIGFSYIRLPMGSSDFARSHYTYNDTAGNAEDLSLSQFSIDHDRQYIIPVLKQALAMNPEIKIMGSPWSAPAWMKDNKSLAKGKLKPEYYDAYARYFVKFIEAYAAEGIEIDAVTIQNEPHHEADNYASMRMEAAEQAKFIKNHLGPAFAAANINTKILIWDHNWSDPDYPIEVLNDPEAKRYIAGSAFHGYAGKVENQAQVHDLHPDKGIYFTESSGGDFAPVFGDNLAWDVQNLIIGSTRNWAKTVLKWNLALDEDYGPRVGGCTDCRGVVTADKPSKSITSLNEEYYAFGHASKFVRPGAVRIKSNTLGSGSIENVAFKNKDGSKALIVLNSAKSQREFKVQWGAQSFTYTLPAGAVAIFTWDGAPTGDAGMNPYGRVEAEDYANASGIQTGVAADAGGGSYVAPAGNEGYIAFDNVQFVDGTATVKVRAAAEQDASIEFRAGSPQGQLLGEVRLANTGGLQQWVTKSAVIQHAAGTLPLYVVLKGQVHLNWFQFSFEHYRDTLNYLSYNGGFEEGTLEDWEEWMPAGQEAAHKAEMGDARSGEYKLTHWAGQAYEQRTYRTVQVPNGTYKASVWLRKGDNIEIQLQAKNYGGPDRSVTANAGFIGDYRQYVLDDIRVTNGQLEIGVHSKATVGEWATFDDFELTPVTTNAPAAGAGAGAPAVPGQVNAAVTGGFRAELRWDSAGSDVNGYKIYRSVKDIAGATVIDGAYVDFVEAGMTGAASLTFMDEGLRGDTTYYYVVTAFNDHGESGVSQQVSITTASGTDTVPPAVPAGLKAEAGVEQAALRWNYSLDSDFARYHVYQNDARIASVEPATESRFVAKGLQPGAEYRFAVTAVDQAGNESAKSAEVTVIPLSAGTLIPFENMDFELGTFAGWSEWHPEQQPIAQFVDNDSPRGQYKLTHWGSGDYIQSTFRTLEVPNGKYKVQVWARTGGGQNKFQLEVKNYGGENLARDMRKADGGSWTPFFLDNIQVTNGQLEIGVYSDAKAGNWAAIDDFQVFSYAPSAPAGIKAIGGDQSASLQWQRNTEFDMASYNVYQDGSLVRNVTAPTVVIEGLTNEQTYTFAVRAVDTDGNESLSSRSVTVTPRVPVPVENAGFEHGDTTGWSSWNSGGDAHFVDSDNPRTGDYKLTHWAGADYMQNTYRTIGLASVTDDTYQASIWVRTGTDLNALRMEIKKYGGPDLEIDLSSASSSDWTLFISEPFQITSGEVEIGLFTDAKGGNWTAFDDFQLIQVNHGDSVPVTGISLVPAELTLNLANHRTQALTAVITPDNATHREVEWSSDNESVAVVNGGVVTAVGAGAATVTATTVDGGYSASARVTVIAEPTSPQPEPKPSPGSGSSWSGSGSTGQSAQQPVDKENKPAVTRNGSTAVIGNFPSQAALIQVSGELLKEAASGDGVTRLLLDLSGASESEPLVVELPVQALYEIAAATSNLSMAFQTRHAEYESSLSAMLPAVQPADDQAVLRIEIGEAADGANLLGDAVRSTLIAAVPAFHIELQSGGVSNEISHFGQAYLSRTLKLDSKADPSGITGIAIDPATGQMSFVPLTVLHTEDGQVHAVLKTNYADDRIIAIIAVQAKTFADIQAHWAKTGIEALSARFIIHGTANGAFDPQQQVTRAEWVSMLVRALGLAQGGTQSTHSFTDVPEAAWYKDSVQTAVEAGLIQGFADGTFKANEAVTREQMAVTLLKAMELADGPQNEAAGSQAQLNMASFKDAEDVSAWAVEAMSRLTGTGILAGDNQGLLQPNRQASRAEAAVVLHKVLQRLNFITE
ncbi:S-layer homology domain-containing protein [Paenibacillus woosongensis]|uniref:Glucan endo-1,6-beta-glucosidase n=1 Tax=Paenibacillus woosongensis TaxID=307580 RepID=A0ABQ4MRJ9_9BACL|nr:S-layer homology domain-containing protein [Paenibacillus woosongensis]GIP58332.1 hypothetical protein J15TS10_21460 [Paenibacillus woosongensis]